jgi:hypothetical protein
VARQSTVELTGKARKPSKIHCRKRHVFRRGYRGQRFRLSARRVTIGRTRQTSPAPHAHSPSAGPASCGSSSRVWPRSLACRSEGELRCRHCPVRGRPRQRMILMTGSGRPVPTGATANGANNSGGGQVFVCLLDKKYSPGYASVGCNPDRIRIDAVRGCHCDRQANAPGGFVYSGGRAIQRRPACAVLEVLTRIRK